jgi:hypothetical protein
MLWFMKESDNQIFERWAMVQDFGAPIRKYIVKAGNK